MDNSYNKKFKNNSTSSKGNWRFYSDSNRSRSHQSWRSKTRDVKGRHFQHLNDSRCNSTDNFGINDRENQLIERQTKTCQFAQQKNQESVGSSGTPEGISDQNLLSNFIPFRSSPTGDFSVKSYESTQSSFSTFSDPLPFGSKENPDCSRMEESSDNLLKPNPFSESSILPLQKSENITDTFYSPNDFPTAVTSCIVNNEAEANEKLELLVDERTDFPTFRFMNIRKRLGICAANHPLVTLNYDQLEAIKLAILEKIFEPEGQQIRPRFFGAGIRNGYLVLICGDNITAAWVRELPKKLELPGGGRLKIVEEPYDNKTFVAVGHFPKSENDSNARILKFLEIQNEGLDISKWKILNKEYEKNSAVRLTFSIDWMSAKILKSRGPLLNYKFGGARFLLKTKKGVKFRQEEACGDNDFDYESFEDFPLTPAQFPNPLAYPEVKKLKCEEFMRQLGEDQILPNFPRGMNDYQAKVAEIVEKSKNSLRLGLSSKERFVLQKKNKRKKRKKIQIKIEPR